MTSVVVLLLAAAATVSVILGDYIEAAAIGAVLVLNTAIGFVTELAPAVRWRRSSTSTYRAPWW